MKNKILSLTPQLISVFLILFIIYSIINFHFYKSLLISADLEVLNNNNNNNDNNNKPSVILADSILGNLAKQFDSISKQFEYKIDLDGKQIFPNDTIKEDIVTNYKSHTYTINALRYKVLGFSISASDLNIHVKPSKIDATKTKIDIPSLLARDVTVNNGVINLSYHQIDLGSIYGIYDKATDKMTMHIPIGVALHYLPHNI
jgi:hypothetical protein